MSSRLAASVTACSSGSPAVSLDNSKSVGRNIFPRIVNRWALTCPTRGSSLATMFAIARVTLSSLSRTGRWITCKLDPRGAAMFTLSLSADAVSRVFTSGDRVSPRSLRRGLGHLLQPLSHITEIDVDGENALIVRGGIPRLLAPFRCEAEEIQHADQILILQPRLA